MGCNVIKYGCIGIKLGLWRLDNIDVHKMIISHVIFIIGDLLSLYNGLVADYFVGRVYLLIE